jgi:hypothetical protein
LWLVAGSVPELGDDGALYNTALVFNPHGELVASHRKAHLYPPTGEPSIFRPGDSLTTFEDPSTRAQPGHVPTHHTEGDAQIRAGRADGAGAERGPATRPEGHGDCFPWYDLDRIVDQLMHLPCLSHEEPRGSWANAIRRMGLTQADGGIRATPVGEFSIAVRVRPDRPAGA